MSSACISSSVVEMTFVLVVGGGVKPSPEKRCEGMI